MTNRLDSDRTAEQSNQSFVSIRRTPGLLVASAPAGSATTDRCVVKVPFTLGRDSKNRLCIRDDTVSKQHFEITHDHGTYRLKDPRSTNGTYVNGDRVKRSIVLSSGAVIRAGRAVLVFHEDVSRMLDATRDERYGIAGLFHACPIIDRLQEAALSEKHILLEGDTGTGKELAAGALKAMILGPDTTKAFPKRNCAHFTTSDEAKSTIFGVGKVFSDIPPRPGLIADAEGGVLFLDEIHRLPDDVKGALLRVVEDGIYSRVGETNNRKTTVRFLMATNSLSALPPDLTPRLRVERLPPLSERVADIPSIFDAVLTSILAKRQLNANDILPLIRTDYYESMCLDGFEADNVRGLKDIADRIVTRILNRTAAQEAVDHVFSKRFEDGQVVKRLKGDDQEKGHYEMHKHEIIQAFYECGGNRIKTVQLLKSRGIRCSREWLGKYLRKWGVKK